MANVGAILVVAIAVMLGGCGGSSSTKTSAGSTTTSTTSGGGSTKTLPAPCTLLTKAEVAPIIGSDALDTNATPVNSFGVAECGFGLTVGVQAKNVSVKTRTDWAKDPSYVMPATKSIAGLSAPANVDIQSAQNQGTITVKLGKNALEITASGYDHPVTEAQLVTLASAALARI